MQIPKSPFKRIIPQRKRTENARNCQTNVNKTIGNIVIFFI